MKTILLIPPQNFPVPAVKGGAVEQLITYLLEENERFGNVRFVVMSKYDKIAANKHYNNSIVYYFDAKHNCKQLSFFSTRWILYTTFCKILLNRFSAKIFRFKHKALSKYQYLCKCIINKENVDGISIEGQWELPFSFLFELIPKESIFTHLHSSRHEDLNVRKTFGNSILLSNYLYKLWTKTSLPGKNIILRNCANTEIFSKSIPSEQQILLRSKLGISKDDYLLIFCGRIVEYKGVEILINAMNLIPNSDIKLLLIGSANFGLTQDNDYEKHINDLCSKDSRIIRIGFLDNSQLPLYYSTADTMLFPSICEEGAPLVPIEGMASGLPIIATVSGGTPEYLSKDSAILLPIDENLTKSMADAVIELYNAPSKRKAMSEAGRERAKLFSKENYYKNFIKIFTE